MANDITTTVRKRASLQESFINLGFVLKDSAKRTDYEKTIIVILNETPNDVAPELSKILNAQIDELPDGEPTPSDVDILIIGGKDKI